jgi:DNA-binding NtrC family response regulator
VSKRQKGAGEGKVKYNILIANDDPRLRDLLCEMLSEERSDVKIKTADSGLEALTMLYNKPVAILIADWQMPDTDGLALIELAQAIQPQTHAILLTAADQDEVQERRHKRRVSFESFTKPFSIEAFLGHIDRVLAQTGLPAIATHNKDEKRGRRTNDRQPQSTLRPALNWG